MKKSVSVSYAKNNLSALLRRVRAGNAVEITDRGVPVARLVAPAASTAGIPPHFIELAQRGLVTLPEREPSAETYRGRLPRPKGPLNNAVVEGLIEDRRNGR